MCALGRSVWILLAGILVFGACGTFDQRDLLNGKATAVYRIDSIGDDRPKDYIAFNKAGFCGRFRLDKADTLRPMSYHDDRVDNRYEIQGDTIRIGSEKFHIERLDGEGMILENARSGRIYFSTAADYPIAPERND